MSGISDLDHERHTGSLPVAMASHGLNPGGVAADHVQLPSGSLAIENLDNASTSLPPTTSTGGRSSCTQTVLTHSNKVCVAIHCSQTIVNNFSREMQKADFIGIFTNGWQNWN